MTLQSKWGWDLLSIIIGALSLAVFVIGCIALSISFTKRVPEQIQDVWRRIEESIGPAEP